MTKTPRRRPRADSVILLKDLAPRKDPKGGSGGKTVFGEPAGFPEAQRPDIPPPEGEAKKRQPDAQTPRKGKEGERK